MPLPQPNLSPDGETQKLRQQLRELTAEAIHNELIFKRCHEREVTMLSAEGLPQLLDRLTRGMQISFRTPYVSLVLDDPEHELRHLLANTGNNPEQFKDVRFTDRIKDFSPFYTRLSSPWLGPYSKKNHRIFFSGNPKIRSIALLPMIRRGCLVGVLHLGSNNASRFTSEHGSHFIHRLATIGAFCLENAVNLEHLTLSGLTDVLTGLHNRRYLDRRLSEEVTRSARYGSALSCLFIDADHFKSVNDLHGHHAGDHVLREIALRVKECLRASDIATRYGGEEFALLLPQTDQEEAFKLAERIRKRICEQSVLLESGQQLQITASIGVSQLASPASEGCDKKLLNDADSALYEAKQLGRNQVRRAPRD